MPGMSFEANLLVHEEGDAEAVHDGHRGSLGGREHAPQDAAEDDDRHEHREQAVPNDTELLREGNVGLNGKLQAASRRTR